MAGLGAFLLVAAAATFVAVRWADIPDSAKFGALVTLTGACLVFHRHLRPTLPVTAAALFHLGVFLVPIDVAAIGIWGGWGWPTLLLVLGLVATVTFSAAAVTERSVVLRWGTWAAVVTLAGGIGAVTTVPAGLVLATVALLAVASHRRFGPDLVSPIDLDLGTSAWAVLAGMAVPLAGVERLGWPAAGVLTDLGLAGEPPHAFAAATGLVAAATLCVVAHRRRNLVAALAGVACALVGLTTTWVSVEPSAEASLVAVAALCLLAEVAAAAWRADPFWRQPTGVVAWVGEGVALLYSIVHVGIVLATPLAPLREPVAGLAAGLVALSWVTATARRPAGSDLSPFDVSRRRIAPIAAAVSAGAAVALTTGSSTVTGVAVGLAAAAVLLVPLFVARFGPAAGVSSVPPTGRVLAAGLLGWAPFAAYQDPAVAAGLGLLGALVLAETAVHTTRRAGAHADRGPVTSAQAAEGSLLAFLALGPIASAGIVLAADVNGTVAVVAAVVALWMTAVVLDRAEQSPTVTVFGGAVPSLPLALIPRVAVVLPLVLATELPPTYAAGVGALIAGLALLDALRLDEPLLLVGAGCALPLTVATLAVASDWTLPEAGLGVTLSGIAWLGLSGTLSDRWVPPAAISAAIAGVVGLALTLEDGEAFSTNLLLVGGTIALLGVTLGQTPLVALGVAGATFGLWGHLGLAEVRALEPYVAPVAVLLLLAGMWARRDGVSSWFAYSPPILLLGGVALAERLAGRPAWHALVAGAVGTAAVAAGGAWRLGAPLVLGTVLVVAVTVHETLGVTAGVPTWAWLAVGGAALLAAGVTMEREGLGPYETGRRLVDLVRDRFA